MRRMRWLVEFREYSTRQYLVPARFLVLGFQYSVLSTWYLVLGTWYSVPRAQLLLILNLPFLSFNFQQPLWFSHPSNSLQPFPAFCFPVHILPNMFNARPVHRHLANKTNGHLSNLSRFLILGSEFFASDILAIKRSAKMSLRFVEATQRISQKLDKLALVPRPKPSAMLAMTDSDESFICDTSRLSEAKAERFVKKKMRFDNCLARCQKINSVKSFTPAIGEFYQIYKTLLLLFPALVLQNQQPVLGF